MSESIPHHRRAVLTALALGAILVTWSELWFYRIAQDVNLALLWGLYCVAAGLIVTGLAGFGVRHRDGVILAAALFGFVIEGVPVAALYEAPPFSFLWTALAWHAMISIGVGVFLYRRVMSSPYWPVALLFNIALGVALGAWNLYSWTAVDVPGHDPIFRWALAEGMPLQFLLGYVIFLLGHLVLDLLAQTAQGPAHLPRGKWWFWGLFLACMALWAMETLPQALPWSLSFVPLAVLCIWGMARHGGPDPSPSFTALLSRAIPLPRYILSLALPLSAILTVTTMADLRFGLEANALAILIAGPVAIVVTLRALARSFRPS